MARQRMYLFERAYVDYAARLRGFGSKVLETSGDIWDWFWRGPGANALEVILRVAVVIATLTLCVLFVRAELSQGRAFSVGMAGTIGVIFVFVFLVLWSWKTPVHVAARTASGVSASGLILALAAAALAAALVLFSTYLLVLFTLTALSVVVFLPTRAAHSLWLLHRRITYRCPYDDCSYNGLPIHVCACGQRYDDLQPSFYGIFYHTCQRTNHKVRLPTMNFLGRNKLVRLCGSCERPLIFSSIGELSERPIAVVGGPNTGKTVFLRQATHQLRERLGALPGSTVRVDSADDQMDLDHDLKLLARGQTPAKTAGDVMQAFGLAVRIPKRLRCLLYLFDAPGEVFVKMESFERKQAIQHVVGIILLVDPFSLPALTGYANPLDTRLKPSETPLQRIVDVLINGVNQMLVRRPTDQCTVPLAVVLSKADAFPTADFPFLSNLYPNKAHTPDETLAGRCRQALKQLGADRSLRALEHKFSTVQYFACTALGRTPNPRNTTPFQPQGVTEPFLWLLGLDLNEFQSKG